MLTPGSEGKRTDTGQPVLFLQYDELSGMALCLQREYDGEDFYDIGVALPPTMVVE